LPEKFEKINTIHQIPESETLNYHNLNLQHMLIQEYEQVQPQEDHDCRYLPAGATRPPTGAIWVTPPVGVKMIRRTKSTV